MSEEVDDERHRKQKHLKDSKEKKRKRGKESSIRHVLRLFNYAASGQTAKLENLIGSHNLDVNSFNSEGHTALHQVGTLELLCGLAVQSFQGAYQLILSCITQAARSGHTDVVTSLLR